MSSTPPVASNLEIELLDGPVPWTHLHVQNQTDSFQFAIVTDRTGATRPGVFASAIPKINSLHPEFVMSVGDLIQGYTDNPARVRREWDDFDTLVKGLNAPFFYVVGNHDLTNPMMGEIWSQRYGPTYYSFVYHDVLFVCLNTMDGGVHEVSEAQLSWLARTLAKHTRVRWTLVFMHTPLWDDYRDVPPRHHYGDKWQRIETLLGDRQFTAFAGHHHRYIKHERRDRRLFTLATAGGGSGLRGPAYGEFDHIMWVTMTSEGPLIANLLLDGILSDDIRTEEQRIIQYSLLGDDTLKPTPVYYSRYFQRGQSSIRLRNDRDVPLEVKLEARPTTPWLVEPREATLQVPPNSVVDHALDVSAIGVKRGDTQVIPVEWSARTQTRDGSSFRISGETRLSVVELIDAAYRPRAPKVDGQLDEWRRLPIRVDKPTQILKQPQAWRGPEDNRFEIALGYDEQFVYVAVRVIDDAVSARPEVPPWRQDGIEIRIDARPDPERSHSAGSKDGRAFLLIAASPNQTPAKPWLAPEDWIHHPPGTRVACVRSELGFNTEIAVPRRWLTEVAGDAAKLVRINIAVNDADQDGQTQSWWWPDWRTARDLPGSGTVRLDR